MHRYIVLLPIIVLIGILVTGCALVSRSQTTMYVDLHHLDELPVPPNSDVRPLRVAIAAVVSPQGSAESYAPLLDYIAEKLGRPVEPVQRRTYTEVNELVNIGEVDLAFVCTSSYLVGAEQFGMKLLAAPQVHGEVAYRAKLIVPASSTAESILDLRGKVFAFTDPLSFSGRMYPVYLVHKAGYDPDTFFGRAFFTYSHDKAIYAVADGVADGASVDSLVFNFALERDPSLAERVRVIYTSPAFGMPPVVVGPNIRPQLFATLQEILLTMHLDADGRAALQALGYDRFVLVDDEDYRSARLVEEEVQCCIDVLQP